MSSSSLQLDVLPPTGAGQPDEPGRRQRRLTHKQIHYIFISQAMWAAVIDGTINFALASAMYRTTRKEIRMWPLERNTIAGDLGVTVIIQGICSTIISCAIVRDSVVKKEIEPFSFDWPDVAWWQGMARSQRWKKWIGAAVSFFSPKQTLSFRYGFEHFAKSLGIIIIRGFLISAMYFFVFWPIAIAITAPLYDGKNLHGTWTPEIIKALFGGTLGLFMTPFIAALVLGSHSARASKFPDIEAHPVQSLSRTSSTVSDHQQPKGKPLSHSRIASIAIIPKSPVLDDSSSSHARIASTTVKPKSPIIADLSSPRSPAASTTIVPAFPLSPRKRVGSTSSVPESSNSSLSHVQIASTTSISGSPVAAISSSPHARRASTTTTPVTTDSPPLHVKVPSTTFIPGSLGVLDSSQSHIQFAPTPIIPKSPVSPVSPSHARIASTTIIPKSPVITDSAR